MPNRYVSLMLFLVFVTAAGCIRTRLPHISIEKNDESSEALTWPKVVELTLASHPDLLSARAEVDSSRYNRNGAFGAFLPSVDSSYTKSRTRSTAAGPAADGTDVDLTVEQTLFNGFGTTGDFIRAKREWEAETLAYQSTSADVRFDVRTAFIDLIRVTNLLTVTEVIAKRREDNAELIRMRYDAGRENKGAMLRARAIAEQARFTVHQTERQIEQRSLELGRHLGGTFQIPIRISETLESMLPAAIEKPGDYAKLAEKIPSVRQSIKSAEAVKASVVSAQSNVWPQVSGAYSYGYSGSDASDLRDNASLSLNVSLPLFEGGQNTYGILEANADYRAAFQAARSARDQAVADLSNAWSLAEDALETVGFRRTFLEAARERAEIVRSQYTSGLVNFQDFDIAEQELADSERSYVDSLADALIREAGWAEARGLTLEEAAHG